METLVVPDEYKISVEQLLLGKVTAIKKGCKGDTVEVHGLTGNDLMITIDGKEKTLEKAIIDATGNFLDLSNSTVTSSSGETSSIVEVVDALEQVAFTVQDLQTKYNNL